MTIYQIADILTGLVESIMLFILFGTFCTKKEQIPNWGYGIAVFGLTVLVNVSNYFFRSGLLNAAGMCTAFILMSFLFQGRVIVKLTISFLTIVLIGVIEIMVLFGITLVYGITVSDVVDIPLYRLLGIIVSKMLSLFTANIIRILFQNKRIRMGPSYWALFLIMFSTSVVAVFLLFKLSYDNENTANYNLSIICSFGLLASTFFAIFLYEHSAKQAEKISAQKQYEQHLKTQLKHLDEVILSQNQIKKFKHDFVNYKIGLASYLEKNDCVGAKEYLDKLTVKLNPTNTSVETGNPALDAILNTKVAIAESKNITFLSNLQIPRELLLDPVDICVIFGNALDNAIEACEKIKSAEKKISLTVMYQKDYLFCKFVNSITESNSMSLKTSKADNKNHGFGLDNIRASLKKYDSEPVIMYTDKEFVLKFIIPISI